MTKFLHNVIDFILNVFQKLLKYFLEIKELLLTGYKELILVGLSLLIVQTMILCCCFFVYIPNNDQTEPTTSNTEIASTIIAGFVEQTKNAPTQTDVPKTLTPRLTNTPVPTIDPFVNIINQYDCIPQDTKKNVGKVVEVVDGDTIKVDINGEVFSLRYIGIDSPEGIDTSNKSEGFGKESYVRNKTLVENKEVLLITDVSELDRYDRLLRYVFVGSMFVNYEMVKSGHAESIRYPPDDSCNGLFDEAQSQAKSNSLGLWASSLLLHVAEPEKTDPREGCDPCYPTVCIPDVGYDLDCGDISFRRFQCDCDPHGFDGDSDGIGCESG